MNIAMISYHTCPRASQEGKEAGGMNVYVMELSRALAHLGHHVDIFTRSHEKNDPLVIHQESNLRVVHIPAGPQSGLPKTLLTAYQTQFADRLFRFIKREGFSYDIVHSHYYMSGSIAEKLFTIEKRMKVPAAAFIVSFHTLGLMKNLVARDTLEQESASRIETEKRLTKRASTIIASSEYDKAYLQYLYDVPGEKIHVVYPGIDQNVFRPMKKHAARNHIGAAHDHKVVLFVGRIEPLKGIDTLLYSMKILKRRHPAKTVCLWIVGGDISESADRWPKTLKNLEDIRKTLGIPKESVRFVGRQPQTELPYYYNAADVVVMPSHYESFGMAALEAMASGTPVIVTNVAGITSRVDAAHVSHIASVNNPLLLADQIAHVLSDPEHAKDLADAARISVATLTWEKTAKKILSVYKSLS